MKKNEIQDGSPLTPFEQIAKLLRSSIWETSDRFAGRSVKCFSMSTTPGPAVTPEPQNPRGDGTFAPHDRDLNWIWLGPHGLRAGWSILLAYILFYLFRLAFGTIFVTANLLGQPGDYAAGSVAVWELIPFLSMIGVGIMMALIEHRRILDFNLSGPGRVLRFFSGFAAGFLALSSLVFGLDWGGWLRFGPPELTGPAIFRFAALWGCAYLLVGCVEEGLFRCYLQFTLTRGIDFWWALAAEASLCLYASGTRNNGLPGIYAIALLGLIPCFSLHQNAASSSGFWHAAWVTSTLFGFVHTYNHGETSIGIFAAASIGFVFCVSVRVTGSAWWAIGCHAAWDWTETYFYGTGNSGLPARGHWLTTNPLGNPLLSGGADGPEGSLLVLAAIALLLLFLVTFYAKSMPALPANRNSVAD